MSATEPLLEVDDVSCSFGGLTAVDRVSFRLTQGELVSVVGPNGAGKTTLFNLVSGQIRPSTGHVRLEGKTVTRVPAHRRARLGVGRTFQIVRPLRTMTVLENVMVGAFHAHPRRAAAERRARWVLGELELSHRAGVVASALTLAEHKRLELARAVAGEPRLLLLDEVMAGLNPAETGRAVEIVRHLNNGGLTVLLIEHDLKAVRALATRVIVLDRGAEIAQGSASAVLDDPRVIEAYLGPRHSG